MHPTIYVVTHYDFNHTQRGKPIDSRFFDEKGNYTFFLIDRNCPEQLKGQNVLFEHKIDPDLHIAGGKTLGEWSFLLAEAKQGFCDYPFYMISSRFYEKNRWLYRDLNEEWETLFGYLKEYGWGYLPSYDRPLRWIDYERVAKQKALGSRIFFPLKQPVFDVMEKLYNKSNPGRVSDFFCNYIGFQSREHLLAYVEFYRPIFDYFLNEAYLAKVDLNQYIETTGEFRNEKPFTFLLEHYSHLFFEQLRHPFVALSYNGYYRVDESDKRFECLQKFSIPLATRINRRCRWTVRKARTECSFFAKF